MELISSPYIIAPVLSWLLAQGIKYLIAISRNKKHIKANDFYKSGGMPSSHSAVVASLALIVGLKTGFSSAIFGVAVIMAAIVIYDAVNVRRSVGEQGIAIASLLGPDKSKNIFVAKGHTLSQVIAGLLLGITVGIVVLQIL